MYNKIYVHIHIYRMICSQMIQLFDISGWSCSAETTTTFFLGHSHLCGNRFSSQACSRTSYPTLLQWVWFTIIRKFMGLIHQFITFYNIWGAHIFFWIPDSHSDQPIQHVLWCVVSYPARDWEISVMIENQCFFWPLRLYLLLLCWIWYGFPGQSRWWMNIEDLAWLEPKYIGDTWQNKTSQTNYHTEIVRLNC